MSARESPPNDSLTFGPRRRSSAPPQGPCSSWDIERGDVEASWRPFSPVGRASGGSSSPAFSSCGSRVPMRLQGPRATTRPMRAWTVGRRVVISLSVAGLFAGCDPATTVTVANECAYPIWVRIMGGSHSDLKNLAPGESLESSSFGSHALVGWSTEENQVGPLREVTKRLKLVVKGADCP